MDDLKIKCKLCSMFFTSKKAVSAHMRVHKLTTESTCAVVTKVVSKLPNKQTEIVDDTKYICAICNTSFATQKSLKLHVRMHNPIKDKSLEQLAEHELKACSTKNVKIKSFFCKICDKSYDMAFQEMHLQTHNGKEKFLCTICNKKFPNSSNLAMHMSIHQDAKQVN